MAKQFDLIIWDWDGTVADSTGMITQSILKAAEKVGLPALTPAKASSIIGLGLNESIWTLYGDIPPQQAADLATEYRKQYFAGENDILLFEGIADTIKALSRRGFKQAVATGKGRRGLNQALKNTGLGPCFHGTRTVDECFSKPHPQMLDELMDDMVVMPERTVMIGDTSYDLQMAQNAGIQSIGVTYGAQKAAQWGELSPIKQFDQSVSLGQWLLANA